MTNDEVLKANCLGVLSGLPPTEYLARCKTEDQKKHWLELYDFYSLLWQSFKDYFEGKPSQHEGIAPKVREFFGLCRDRYLAWYTVVQWGWTHIEAWAQKHGKDLSSYASCPGEALIRVLEDDCAAMMHEAMQDYHRWASSGTRELAKLDREVTAAIDSGKPLDHKQQNSLRTYQHKLRQARKPFEAYANFAESCIVICEEKAKSDSTLRRHLTNYKRTSKELDRVIQRELHPSKKIRGHEWMHGHKKMLGKYGGTTS